MGVTFRKSILVVKRKSLNAILLTGLRIPPATG
jgi:hypothetical protein